MKIDSYELLRNYSKKTLVEIARLNGLPLATQKKEPYVAALAQHFSPAKRSRRR